MSTPKPKLEIDPAEAFLEHFDGHTIVIHMNDKGGAPAHLHGGYEAEKGNLQNANEDGRSVFFTVNSLDLSLDPVNPKTGKDRHRTKKMVTRCRAIFMDADEPHETPQEFPLEPSLIVNTSPGKYHYYWIIDGGTDEFDEWQRVQNGLIAKYRGDKRAKDLTRYLRLPGYYHLKAEPYMVELIGGNEKRYSWEELVDVFPPAENQRTKLDGTISSAESKSINDHIASILDGSDFHGSLTSLTHQYKSQGMDDAYIIAILQSFMNVCPEDKRNSDGDPNRWQSRFDDIERDVRNYQLEEGNYTVELNQPEPVTSSEMPWPPGRFGSLAQDAWDMANYKYKEVSVICALGLVAGITGRKFNVRGEGLNICISLIMDTGMGKEHITKFINHCLNKANVVGTASSFIGDTRFTGAPSIYNSLKDARSQICIFTEAGLMLKSKAGDASSTSRVMLSIYSKSGSRSYLGSEGRTEADKRLPVLRAVALSIISESTPAILLEAFADNNSAERGELPRQSIFRVIGDRPDLDEEAWKRDLSESNFDRIRELVNKCSTVQATPDPDAIDIDFAPDIKDEASAYNRALNKQYNDLKSEDPLKAAMISRAYVKALKISAIASIYNGHASIQQEEWEWAIALNEFEFKGMSMFFQSDQNSGILGVIETALYKPIVKLLEIEKNAKMYDRRLASLDVQKHRIPLPALRDKVRNNKLVKEMNSRYPNSDALDQIKSYMRHPDKKWIVVKQICDQEYWCFQKSFWLAMGAKNVK